LRFFRVHKGDFQSVGRHHPIKRINFTKTQRSALHCDNQQLMLLKVIHLGGGYRQDKLESLSRVLVFRDLKLLTMSKSSQHLAFALVSMSDQQKNEKIAKIKETLTQNQQLVKKCRQCMLGTTNPRKNT